VCAGVRAREPRKGNYAQKAWFLTPLENPAQPIKAPWVIVSKG
jgi:hypothetical protein